jgi:hypothetical protein
MSCVLKHTLNTITNPNAVYNHYNKIGNIIQLKQKKKLIPNNNGNSVLLWLQQGFTDAQFCLLKNEKYKEDYSHKTENFNLLENCVFQYGAEIESWRHQKESSDSWSPEEIRMSRSRSMLILSDLLIGSYSLSFFETANRLQVL